MRQTVGFTRATEWVRGGFATPHQLAANDMLSSRVDRSSKTYKPAELSGCIYRADGTKVPLSERPAGRGDLIIASNPDHVDPPADAARVAGRSIYLGQHMGGHYGHFLTEGLSTFWVFEEHQPEDFDHFVFHPFVFDMGDSEFFKHTLDTFGIPEEKVLVVGSEWLRFDEILVPERLFRINDAADPSMRRVYERLAAPSVREGLPKRLYLSRRKFTSGGGDRLVANEVLIEKSFERRGFVVEFPEERSFAYKLAMYTSADCIAGISGSALHNAIFMKPDSLVVELGDPRFETTTNPNQVICNQISGVRSAIIPFKGLKFGPRMTMLFSIRAIERGLDDLQDKENLRAGAGRVHANPAQALQIAYRAARPTLGHLAAKVRLRR